MDQLKPILAAIKTHRFWIISGFVFLGFMGTWYLETNRLKQETEDQKSKIEQAFSTVSSISSTPLHPNPETHKGMDSLHAKYYAELQAAWSEQYNAQKDSLVWHGMTDEFVAVVEKLKPIESKVAADLTELDEPLTLDQRNQYRFFIRDELPQLAEIIGAHWAPAGPKPKDKVELVTWNPSNINNIVETRFSWDNSTPSTLEVLYAQEDIWILTALLEVIRNVNGNIRGKYEAPIKEIDFLEFGADAIGLAGQIQSLEGRTSGGGMSAEGSPMGMGMAEGMGMDMGGASGADDGTGNAVAGSSSSTDPAENRYVDKDFKPLAAERLRKAYDSENPEDAIYAVAKRIPVRMRVKMDQRKISRLLAECANYKMQIEVRQVRINCQSGSTFRGSGMGGMGGGMGMDGGMDGDSEMMGGFGGDGGFGSGGFGEGDGMDGSERMMGGLGNAPGGQTLNLKDSSPWDVDVEIYGIILFYNPVEISKIEAKLNLPEAAPEPTAPVPTEAG